MSGYIEYFDMMVERSARIIDPDAWVFRDGLQQPTSKPLDYFGDPKCWTGDMKESERLSERIAISQHKARRILRSLMRPMSEAPKDGTVLLVHWEQNYHNNAPDDMWRLVYWNKDKGAFFDAGDCEVSEVNEGDAEFMVALVGKALRGL